MFFKLCALAPLITIFSLATGLNLHLNHSGQFLLQTTASQKESGIPLSLGEARGDAARPAVSLRSRVEFGFPDWTLKGRNPNSKANASLLQESASLSAAACRSLKLIGTVLFPEARFRKIAFGLKKDRARS